MPALTSRLAVLSLFVAAAASARAQGGAGLDESSATQQLPAPVADGGTAAKAEPAGGADHGPMISPPPTAAPLDVRTLAKLRLMPDDSWIRVGAAVELGAVSVVSHTIQFGKSGDRLDYVKQGGQDNLFPFARASLEATLFQHHTFVALYQPLTVETSVVLDRDLRVYDEVFAAGTPLDLKYGFDFVRFSYFYDFFADVQDELGVGLSLQLRDADIQFASADGNQRVGNSGLGPVPILKGRFRHQLDNGFSYGVEADGFWASGRIITGTANDFEGAIADVALRAGAPVTGFANAFATLRYLGGGARGVEEQEGRTGDGFADNWLHTVVVSMGLELR